MRGDNYVLALTTTEDTITGEVKPLFAFPVQVCKATEDKSPKFDIVAPSGAKRVQQYVDPATDTVVSNDECPRGVFVGDQFKPIDPEAIKAIDAPEGKITTMVVDGTRDLAGLREKYGDRITDRYFLQVPAKNGSAMAYRLTYEALRAETKGKKVITPAQALVVKRTKTSKQALGFIYANEDDECLVMCEVKFAAQMRKPDAQVKSHLLADVSEAQIAKARQVILSLPDADEVLQHGEDTAAAAKQKLIDEALAGATEFTKPTPVSTTVATQSLEDLLNASLEAVAAPA